jgi:hypothetical protein
MLAWSVAGMTWVMWLNADPEASLALLVGFTGLSAAGTVFAYVLYRPLFRDLRGRHDHGWPGSPANDSVATAGTAS